MLINQNLVVGTGIHIFVTFLGDTGVHPLVNNHYAKRLRLIEKIKKSIKLISFEGKC